MLTVFSGIQPSGELHIGNYLGAVRNWVALQKEHECYFCVVDYHAITAHYDPRDLMVRRHGMAMSILAAGVDPSRAVLFVQSAVPEHTELAWIFNTVCPLGDLERQTQFKEKGQKQESIPVGLLTYPVLQAADILLYLADSVPVGEDQVQHLELSRDISRKWNARFSPDTPYFPEPKPLLTTAKRIMGLDGQAKMSKSLNNTIGLLEDPESIWQKLRPAVTDPKRVKRSDPGTPEVCNIFQLHKVLSDAPTVEHVAQQCRSAGWGCLDCKRVLHESIERELVPIRTRAAELARSPAVVEKVLREGAEKAAAVARVTMHETKERMGFA